MTRRVVVVGGGVAGSSAAWHLATRGDDVTLLERFGPGHDRGSSHGSSRIFRLTYPDQDYVSLAARALPLWRRLERETGIDVLTLTGAVDHGPAEATRPLYDALTAAGHAVEQLDPAEVARRWPGLRADTTAVFHPEAGRLHADHAVTALQRAATSKGARIRHDVPVTAVRARADDRAEVVVDDGTTIVADAVVVAAGGWTPTLLSGVVDGLPPLRVTQEQPVHLPAADPLRWPSFIHYGGAGLLAGIAGYGLGSVDGVKVGFHGVGPVVDPDHRDRGIDQAALHRVRDYAREWLPGADVSQPTAITCLYTTTPDEDFVIDRQGPITVLSACSGHGFKFGSVLGELAADVVDGNPALPRFALGKDIAV